jgi:uridylate kinase
MSTRLSPKQYKRALIKLSGEMLMGDAGFGIDQDACSRVATALHCLQQNGLQVAVVIGGGNIFRGIKLSKNGMPRSPADQMGMLATMINGIALKQSLIAIGSTSKVMSAIDCPKIVSSFNFEQAMQEISNGTIMIFVGGTGNPYFTTDTAAAMRAAEIKADILLKATKVDGIYNRDPLKFADAKKYNKISYAQILAEKLEVMDATAIALCQQNNIPIVVFDMQMLFEKDPLPLILPPNSKGTFVDTNV